MPSEPAAAENPVLPVYVPQAVSAAARLTGTLALRDGCLVVDSGGDASAVPVFPEGQARWDAEERVLVFKNGRYALGDTIVLGGGFAPSGPDRPAIRDLPPGCPDDRLWLAG